MGLFDTLNTVSGTEYRHGPTTTKSEAKEGVAQKVLAAIGEL